MMGDFRIMRKCTKEYRANKRFVQHESFPSTLQQNRPATTRFEQTSASLTGERAAQKDLLYAPRDHPACERRPATFREHLFIGQFILHMRVDQHNISILADLKRALRFQTKDASRIH